MDEPSERGDKIEKAWRLYAETMMPGWSTDSEYSQMRCAFLGGVLAALGMLANPMNQEVTKAISEEMAESLFRLIKGKG